MPCCMLLTYQALPCPSVHPPLSLPGMLISPSPFGLEKCCPSLGPSLEHCAWHRGPSPPPPAPPAPPPRPVHGPCTGHKPRRRGIVSYSLFRCWFTSGDRRSFPKCIAICCGHFPAWKETRVPQDADPSPKRGEGLVELGVQRCTLQLAVLFLSCGGKV